MVRFRIVPIPKPRFFGGEPYFDPSAFTWNTSTTCTSSGTQPFYSAIAATAFSRIVSWWYAT